MKRLNFKLFAKDEQGLVTAEFVAISFALFMIIFFVVELTLLYFFIQSSQKAAQMGVRMAVVSDTMASGLPLNNSLAAGELFGGSCSSLPSSCTGFATVTCSGGVTGCDLISFNRILARMQNFMPGLEAAHVNISYSYQGLGFAGGPVIPLVTVTISGVPHQTGILGVVLGATVIATIPAVSSTLTGEDLSDAGA